MFLLLILAPNQRSDILVLNLVVHLGVFELGCAFARLAQNKKLNPERTPADLRGDLQPIFKQAFLFDDLIVKEKKAF
jgi:hypothetical protein